MKKVWMGFLICLVSYAQTQAQVVYDFENWHNYAGNLQIANNWNGSDSLLKYFGTLLGGSGYLPQIEKELPGNGSATAIKVLTKNQPAVGTIFPAGPFPGLATNGVIEFDAVNQEVSITGGLPFNSNPISASMWVKNLPVGGDTTEISIFAIDNSDNDNLQYAIADTLFTSSINSFTKITLPFKVTDTLLSTTLIRVLITSGGGLNGGHDGTAIIVDDIEFLSPSGIPQYLNPQKAALVYPTTLESMLQIQFKKPGNRDLHIYDMQGCLLLSKKLAFESNQIDVSSLSQGNYLYEITEGPQKIQSGKLLKR